MLFIVVSVFMGKKPHVEWKQTVIINFFIFMINEVMWAVYNYRRSKQMYEKSQRLTVQFEYNILRTQVNPHFLFNSLHILYLLRRVNTDCISP
ncbi:MAG: histidine kinase [Prevotella sp.]|nr:histidine kinase [Prevotella sp.]MCM1075601.1 histidine kinase [Ruminococcus sp.]